MTRYKEGRAMSANNQRRRKGRKATGKMPGRNSGMQARLRHERAHRSDG